ncbi:sporulation protein [Ammoniphilus sp. 3BR4]|uniref:sporulation protein n=1 Tax=Ammoniphilus sp. 3BR4 TaxID=3158265 RepID=UPI003465900F
MLTFRKILSTIGIGSAKVHTVILQRMIKPGQTLKGEVHLYGGGVEQEIHGVDVEVIFEYYKDEEDSENHYIEYVLGRAQIQGLDSIKANEEKIFPFEIEIPLHSPLTNANQEISLRTSVHIPFAPDPQEIQPISILDRVVETCFYLFAKNGYLLAVGSGMSRYQAPGSENIPFEQSFILHKWVGNEFLEWKFHFSFEEDVIILKIQDQTPFCFSRTDENERKKQFQILEQWIQAAT